MTEYCLVYVKNNKDTISLFGGKADSSESQPIIKRTNSYGKLTFESGIVNSKLKDGVYKKGIYGKDIKGSEKTILELGAILSTPIVDKGIIYFGDANGLIYAYKLK